MRRSWETVSQFFYPQNDSPCKLFNLKAYESALCITAILKELTIPCSDIPRSIKYDLCSNSSI
jgi:hypothetical protein